jgi:HlyD family secretion protein
MDVQRKVNTTKKILLRVLYTLIVLGVLGGVTYYVMLLEPAAPPVQRGMIVIDTVKRGTFVRNVRGPGTLVPEEIRWIPAVSDGVVEEILMLPGTIVTPDTTIMIMSNPDLELSTLDAKWQVKSAEAEYASLQKQLENDLLNLKTAASRVEADGKEADLKYKSDQELFDEGLKSGLEMQVSQIRSTQLAELLEIEKSRVKVQEEYAEKQLAVLEARIAQASAVYELSQRKLEALHIKAGFSGVLSQVDVEVGQRLAPGTILAKVTNPNKLKAVLRIDQNQARDVVTGLSAMIDTRNGIVKGTVSRIDPTVLEGSVSVDIALDENLPKGARPDLAVDGTIELFSLEDVLYVGRPVYGQQNSIISMFKIIEGTPFAVRQRIELGAGAVHQIEIQTGLEEGDQVIISDMNEFDEYDRVQIQ